MTYKLTYSTMFDPPAEMHARFEAALAEVRGSLGRKHNLHIDGADVAAATYRPKHSPIDTQLMLGDFAEAGAGDAERALRAAHAAFADWRGLDPTARIAILRKAARIIEERVYTIAAALALEVGKNRMEALGETQETADFFSFYCDEFERQHGFDHELPRDPLPNTISHNRSVMRPYGAWVVITPFNFPLALAGGPVAAALVTGNTVVLKGATDTPWSGRLLADCLRDAGVPRGAFNYLSGPSAAIGDALIGHPLAAGVTFTGSYEVGMHIARASLERAYPRPCIAEMGGKNACIVTRNADLERAISGIVRSAFGMSGQKCSALSRLYVAHDIATEFIARLQSAIQAIRVGDPTRLENWMGPLINEHALNRYRQLVSELARDGQLLEGGRVLSEGNLSRGYYVEPTLAEAPLRHRLWKHEMFLPILMVHRIADLDEGIMLANDSDLGLTAGIYGSVEDVERFMNRIEAGVTYANRPQGATTGAWPGYQPFGGWKGSSTTGKGIASFYYLAQYLREQSRTVVE